MRFANFSYLSGLLHLSLGPGAKNTRCIRELHSVFDALQQGARAGSQLDRLGADMTIDN